MPSLPDYWEVVVKDDRPWSYEISLVRASFEHGKKSYGWANLNIKEIISGSGGPNSNKVSDRVFNKLVALARQEMLERNGELKHDAVT